jgi:hypothetical protein
MVLFQKMPKKVSLKQGVKIKYESLSLFVPLPILILCGQAHAQNDWDKLDKLLFSASAPTFPRPAQPRSRLRCQHYWLFHMAELLTEVTNDSYISVTCSALRLQHVSHLLRVLPSDTLPHPIRLSVLRILRFYLQISYP